MKTKIVIYCISLIIISCSNDSSTNRKIIELTSDIIEIEENLFKLSDMGSSRATAYPNLNKIDNSGDNFFISWLGVNDKNFIPALISFNVKKKRFGNIYYVDSSFNNHGVWLPYLKISGNHGFLMFTLGDNEQNPT